MRNAFDLHEVFAILALAYPAYWTVRLIKIKNWWGAAGVILFALFVVLYPFLWIDF